jgi:hypothetical protein
VGRGGLLLRIETLKKIHLALRGEEHSDFSMASALNCVPVANSKFFRSHTETTLGSKFKSYTVGMLDWPLSKLISLLGILLTGVAVLATFWLERHSFYSTQDLLFKILEYPSLPLPLFGIICEFRRNDRVGEASRSEPAAWFGWGLLRPGIAALLRAD